MGGQSTSTLSCICCNSDNSNILKRSDFDTDILAKSETELSVKFLKSHRVRMFSRGIIPQLLSKKKWKTLDSGRTRMNIALFSPVMKLSPRNPGRQANLDVGVHGLLPLSGTLGVSAPERGDHPHSSTDTREEDISQNRSEIKTPTITATRQCSDERHDDNRKSNALYEQWY